MDGGGLLFSTLFATVLATVLVVAVTLVALGPRSVEEARLGWRALFPRTRSEAEAEIASIEAMRRDPELANMFFLSRFIVMVVQEAVGQMLAGLLAAWSFTEEVSDKIVEAPFALASLWLAVICLVVYRRITNFERWRGHLLARTS
jgi:small-conductance mechanosensitive channel